MKIKWLLLFFLSFTTLCVAQEEGDGLEKEIIRLEEVRTKLLGKAHAYEDQAMKSQFRAGEFNETKRAYVEADACRYQAAKIERQISSLKKRQEKIALE